jgi:D-serine deaminase-like pyridoxal phosphate-dependent protein
MSDVVDVPADPQLILREMYDAVRRAYGPSVGRHREELVTPALVLDLAAAQRNNDEMADALSELDTNIRPHAKVHKSPELARRQIDAGAIGLSVATVWEAVAFVESGIDSVFVVNTVAGAEKIRSIAELGRRAEVILAVDDVDNARQLSEAAAAAGSALGVMIEIDTGMDRAGVDDAAEALDLARSILDLPALRFMGLTGYEGHCSLTPDRAERKAKQSDAMRRFIDAAERLESGGIACPIRSAGGTATWDWTAAYPGVTEIQAGTYVVMDNFHRAMVGDFENALTVQTTVISVRPDRVIVDAGSKSVGDGELSTIVGHDLVAHRFDEEHGIFASPRQPHLRVGDSLALVPGYAPGTVNWFDAFHVMSDDVVVDVWPVIARGPGHHGLVRR